MYSLLVKISLFLLSVSSCDSLLSSLLLMMFNFLSLRCPSSSQSCNSLTIFPSWLVFSLVAFFRLFTLFSKVRHLSSSFLSRSFIFSLISEISFWFFLKVFVLFFKIFYFGYDASEHISSVLVLTDSSSVGSSLLILVFVVLFPVFLLLIMLVVSMFNFWCLVLNFVFLMSTYCEPYVR